MTYIKPKLVAQNLNCTVVYDCVLRNAYRWDLVGVKLGPVVSLH